MKNVKNSKKNNNKTIEKKLTQKKQPKGQKLKKMATLSSPKPLLIF